MHLLSKRDLSSDELDTLRRSRKPTTPRMGKCKQTRRRKLTCRTLTCSSLCSYSMKRHRFYRLESFAQNTDIHMSGETDKNHV